MAGEEAGRTELGLKNYSVLVVVDEACIRQSLKHVLQDEGYQVTAVESGEDCLNFLGKKRADVVLLDIWLPGIDGLETLARIRESENPPVVVMISGHGTIETAVRATKKGAFDFIEKPLSIEKTLLTLKHATEELALSVQNRQLRHKLEGDYRIIGNSVPMKALRQQLALAAPTNGRVLVYGESGTGKELIARMIHRLSVRRRGPLVAVNCAAFPETLLESELFGHVRGAFTGATTTKPGKFELANGGTLLLDEVGEMPLSLQPKLLRVLQEREVDRLGDTRPAPVDVRVVGTTNRQLKSMVAEGRFRSDLYYRLNVVPVTIPPLRERREDIAELAQHFLEKHARKSGGRQPMLSPELIERLETHEWPGNVRELENFIRRALALATGPRLGPELAEDWDEDGEAPRAKVMAAGAAGAAAGGTGGVSLRAMERQLLEQTLESTDGNRTRAAEILGISIRTMRNKIKEYGLPPRGA